LALALLLPALFLLYGYVQADTESGYLSVTGPCNFIFPRDHGAHPGYRTEWWYYTGNLTGNGGRQYGFQLTFFRSQISPSQDAAAWPEPRSAWRTQQLYLGHAAVSDISGKLHLQAEDVARNALGMAGVDQDEKKTRVYLKNWSAAITDNVHDIHAESDQFAYRLHLSSLKEPVSHGLEGYSKKGLSAERSSCYYSFTRLASQGTLALGGKTFPVSGQSWMDHEFSTAPLEPGIVGWDWFSLQLSDRTEIMIFLLREVNGSLNSASSGTFVAGNGRPRHLSVDDFNLRVLDTWQSKKSGATYPSQWHMTIPSLSISLDITSNLANQEMHTAASTGVTYWEGSVSCRGQQNGRAIIGAGYVELTGYAQPFDADL
jgi:predicted secreted hydrolase